MFRKTFAMLLPGIFLLCMFSFFSPFPQNPGQVGSVHLFAYHCMLETEKYKHEWEYHSSAESAAEDCHYNLRLSVLVAGYGGAGIILTVHSLKTVGKKIPNAFRKTFAMLLPGIFLLCLLSVLLSLPGLPGDVNTVHLVTYHCMLDAAAQSLVGHTMNNAECYFDPGLSMLVFACGASGICLIAYPLGQIRCAGKSLANSNNENSR